MPELSELFGGHSGLKSLMVVLSFTSPWGVWMPLDTELKRMKQSLEPMGSLSSLAVNVEKEDLAVLSVTALFLDG